MNMQTFCQPISGEDARHRSGKDAELVECDRGRSIVVKTSDIVQRYKVSFIALPVCRFGIIVKLDISGFYSYR